MNQTNIKQWTYAHRELIFLNYDLLDTLYQSALYINQISFFFPNINQISFFFQRNFCIIYKKKKLRMHRINHLHVFIYLIAIPVDC